MERVSNINIKNRLRQLIVLFIVISLGMIIAKVVEARKSPGFVKAEMQQ
jgi:hypothetical protein